MNLVLKKPIQFSLEVWLTIDHPILVFFLLDTEFVSTCLNHGILEINVSSHESQKVARPFGKDTVAYESGDILNPQ